MRCIPRDKLFRFFVGQLSKDENDQIESHLESCGSCRKVADQLADDGELRRLHQRQSGMDDLSEQEAVERLRDQIEKLALVRLPIQSGSSNRSMRGPDDSDQPKRVGRFRIERCLGVGGFGAVYLAHDERLRRDVALKLPHQTSLLDPGLQRRFVRECEVTALLHHPNIVQVFEAGDTDGTCFLATEFVPGKNLAEWLQDRNGRMATIMAARIVADLASAVHHAHQHQVLHRDIKPSNILMDEACSAEDLYATPKLTDFGLAKLAESDASITASEAVVGTPRYMAPEQASGRRDKLGPATDVYGLGAVLYEIVTGRAPIDGADTADTLRRVVTDQPDRPRTLAPEIERDLESICLKCLDKEPARRYPTAATLAEDLERFVRGQPTIARPVTALESVGRWACRNPRSAAIAAGSLFAVIAFVTVLMIQNVRLERLADDLTVALNDAERLQQRAEDSDLLARQHLYSSDLQLAEQARRNDDIARFTELMNRHIPRPGQIDLRGFEWHHMMRHVQMHKQVLADANHALYFVCYSPDGQRIAAAGEDAVVRIYDAVTSGLIRKFDTTQREVNGLAFTPDGHQLATTGDDGTLRFWELSSGRQLQEIQSHSGAAYNVVILRDHPFAVTCGQEKVIRIWNIETGAAEGVLEGHTEPVDAIALSPDGTTLASASGDSTARLWNLSTRTQANMLMHGHRVSCVAFSPSGHRLATGCMDKKTRLWDVAKGCLLTTSAHLDDLQSIAFSPDETTLASGDRGGTIVMRRIVERTWSFPPGERIRWCKTARDANVVAAASSRRVGVLDIDTGRSEEVSLDRPRILKPPETSPRNGYADRAFAVSPSGNRIACVTEIHARDSSMGNQWRLHATLDTSYETICSLAFAPDEQQLLSGNVDGTVRLWDLKNGLAVSTLIGHDRAPIRTVAVAPNGSIIASGGDDGRVIVWDTGRKVPRFILEGHHGRVNSLTFTPDGELLLSAGSDRSIRTWDPRHGNSVAVFEGHFGSIESMQFSPDGTLIALNGDSQNSIRSWINGPQGLAKNIPIESQSVSFSSDGKDVVMGIEETVEVSQVHSSPYATLMYDGTLHTGFQRVYSLAFSPDGRRLLSSGSSGDVTLWDRLITPSERPLATKHIMEFALSTIGNSIVVAGQFGVREIELETDHVLRELSSSSSQRPAKIEAVEKVSSKWYRVAASSDGSMLAGATEHNVVTWKRGSGTIMATWDFDQVSSTGQLRFIPGSHRLAMTHPQDDLVRVLDPASGNRICSLRANSPKVLACSPDGRSIATNSLNDVILWDTRTDSIKQRFVGHRSSIGDIAFDHDGRRLASVGNDRQLIVWDIADGVQTFSSVAHDDNVNAVAYSRDGRTIVTGAQDGSIKAWHAATGQALIPLAQLPDAIRQLTFSRDGNRLLCLCANGQLTILQRPHDNNSGRPNCRLESAIVGECIDGRSRLGLVRAFDPGWTHPRPPGSQPGGRW